MSERARHLHDAPWQGVFYLAGGGSTFLDEVLSTAGASRTLLEARIPYAGSAMADLLGAPPEQACSETTARALAMSAFQRARLLREKEAAAHTVAPVRISNPQAPDAHISGQDDAATFGFACTASLATDRAKQGEHRAHAAIQTATHTFTAFWTFSGSRAEEEEALGEALWAKLGRALELSGVEGSVALDRTAAEPAWQKLVLGGETAIVTAGHSGELIFPGAFNPLHEGHRRMLGIAEELTGLPGAYELSVANVDKPFLDYREIEVRLKQFDRPVWLTRLPTFIEKARRFPGATFVVGLDTLLRLCQSRYYGSAALLDEALRELDGHNVHYIVFGREIGGSFRGLSDVAEDLPASVLARCTAVGADRFSMSVSSSSLRRVERQQG